MEFPPEGFQATRESSLEEALHAADPLGAAYVWRRLRSGKSMNSKCLSGISLLRIILSIDASLERYFSR